MFSFGFPLHFRKEPCVLEFAYGQQELRENKIGIFFILKIQWFE
jgi:hypothetical protein